MLVDAAEYFSALRQSMLKAERSIFLVGWDIDSRVRLAGEDDPEDGAPLRLRDFLTHLVKTRPDLRIHVLLWDFSILYALEREPIPALNLKWATPPQIEVCLDDLVPLGASHHQKLVIIDDAVAYCGGIDLAMYRWDTRAHLPANPLRIDPAGNSYKPFHDAQCVVDGAAAKALADLVADRWHNAACKAPVRETGHGDPWPDDVTPEFTDWAPAIARTVAPLNRSNGVFEVERLYIDMIGAARKTIYIENQFLTSQVVATALADALRKQPDLEVLLVSSRNPHGFLEEHSMATGRARFMETLADAGADDRVRLVHPVTDNGDPDGQDVLVHAKVMIVDDTLLRVGSSNLNNRSMGTDGECDLVFEAETPEQRAVIKARFHDLLGEHLGLDVNDVAAAINDAGGLIALVDARQSCARTLVKTDTRVTGDPRVAAALEPIADPERPGDVAQFIGDMMSARPAGTPIRGRWIAGGGVVLIAALIAIWQFSPLNQFTDPARLKDLIDGLRGDPWAFALIPLGFVVASNLMFPVTVLIGATAFVFPPTAAFIVAFAGSIAAAAVNYAAGAALGRSFLRDMMGRRLNKISRALASRGVMTVVALRIVPIAPFTLINLVAGASHISFRSFLLGTLIGLLPGVAAMTLVGNRMFEFMQNPSPREFTLMAGAVIAWLGVAWLGQRGVKWARRFTNKTSS